MDMDDDASRTIQSHWRGAKCRRAVRTFSPLPCDAWRLVLHHLTHEHDVLMRIVTRRCTHIIQGYMPHTRAEWRRAVRTVHLVLTHTFPRSIRELALHAIVCMIMSSRVPCPITKLSLNGMLERYAQQPHIVLLRYAVTRWRTSELQV